MKRALSLQPLNGKADRHGREAGVQIGNGKVNWRYKKE
jgi:hypothetical protein